MPKLRIGFGFGERTWGGEILEGPGEGEALELGGVLALLGYQARHPPFDGLGSERGKMGLGVEPKTDRGTPGVSLDCTPA